MAETSIEWTDRVWNCLRGCSRVSRGCGDGAGGGCYAERMAHRFSGEGMPYAGLTRLTAGGPRWTGEVRTLPELLAEPLRWRKPQRVFVNSMSDLFHEAVSNEFIAAVFGVMAACPPLIFQVLTKRADRMRRWFDWLEFTADRCQAVFPLDSRGWRRAHVLRAAALRWGVEFKNRLPIEALQAWPLPNVWLGVSVEDQPAADSRIPHLLATPAAVRFLSCEPLLGPVDLDQIRMGDPALLDCEGAPYLNALRGATWWADGDHSANVAGLDWVIVGGESGPGARPCAEEWIRSLIEQCRGAGLPAFVKQLGAYSVSTARTAPAESMAHPERLTATDRAPNGEVWAWRAGLRDRAGGDPAEWPEDLRIREFPNQEPTP